MTASIPGEGGAKPPSIRRRGRGLLRFSGVNSGISRLWLLDRFRTRYDAGSWL